MKLIEEGRDDVPFSGRAVLRRGVLRLAVHRRFFVSYLLHPGGQEKCVPTVKTRAPHVSDNELNLDFLCRCRAGSDPPANSPTETEPSPPFASRESPIL